jgi:UDPglucose 6-dehydrogenase
MKIGIIGNGFVGKATCLFTRLPEIEMLPYNEDENNENPAIDKPGSAFELFSSHKRQNPGLNHKVEIQVMVYDIRQEACIPYGVTLEEVDNMCDILFFCLPTPLYYDGTCYTKILEESISKCKNPYKVIRSTVPVGFSKQHGCYFMPEFLTEANWENDFKMTEKWIVGVPSEHSKVYSDTEAQQHIKFKNRIRELISFSRKNGSIDNSEIVFCTTNDAEMLKLTKNCFLSAKVSIMNEIYDFCCASDSDYDKVIEMAKSDARMGTSHFKVPGPDGLRGFGGTCFPKDTHSIYCQMEKCGVNSVVFPAILSRNDTVDRPAREWANDVWRTTVPLPKGSKVVVVFDDGSFTCNSSNSNSNSINQYLTSLCNDKLQNNHYLIIITSERDFKDNIINNALRNRMNHNNNLRIKFHDITKPIFIPIVDEIYYAGYNSGTVNSRVINELSSITRVIELWKQHEKSCLYVTKPNELGSTINYTRLFEDYYLQNLAHHNDNDNDSNDTTTPIVQTRRLLVLF